MWQRTPLSLLLLSIYQMTKLKQLVTSVMSFIQDKTIHELGDYKQYTVPQRFGGKSKFYRALKEARRNWGMIV